CSQLLSSLFVQAVGGVVVGTGQLDRQNFAFPSASANSGAITRVAMRPAPIGARFRIAIGLQIQRNPRFPVWCVSGMRSRLQPTEVRSRSSFPAENCSVASVD